MKQHHHIRIYIFLIILLYPIYGLYAQRYNFTNYTVENGLSQSQVLAVCQDNDGVMWFGTNGGGITKFDGKNYEYLTDKDGLADNVVFSIVKDNKGRMLIGTNNGLSVFEANRFKNYTTQNGLTHNRVYKVLVDANNRIILGTGKGVSILKDTVCNSFNMKSPLDSALVFDVYQDCSNYLWFSTLGSGIYKYNGVETIHYGIKEGFKNEYAYSVIEKEKGVYWFLMHKGLYELVNDTIHRIDRPDLPQDATFYSSIKYSNNTFWLGTDKGVLKYENNVFKNYAKNNGLLNNNIWRLFQDKENNVWFASKENGISKLAKENLMVRLNDETNTFFNSVSAIHQSENGAIYIGSPKGITILNDGQTKSYTNNDWGGHLNKSEVTAIAEDVKGIIWIGTSYGLLKFNGEKFERIEAKINKNNNYIHSITIDAKGLVWLGTKAGVAQVIDGAIVELKQSGLPQNFVYEIYQDTDASYWFGADDGLYMYNQKSVKHFSPKDGFVEKRVNKIVRHNNKLWIATNVGLFIYNNDKFTALTEKEGLASNIIQSLIIDVNYNIWVGLPNGAAKITPKTVRTYDIRHYGIEDGFVGEGCLLNSILVDNQNHIWFGAEKGLMVYQPEYDRLNELEPITRIKSIQLFAQKTDWKLFADSVDVKNLPVNLELEHNRNYLSFNFIAVSHTAPAKVRYKYMLKGLDKDWLAETDKTEAIYPSIPPGDYEFLVMGSNGDGVWNKVPTSFKFTILPPFWRTWWFYSIIAGLILMAIYSYAKIKSANTKILKQSHTIEEKNEALNEANVLIAGKNKNIMDSINYALRIQQSFLTSEKVLKRSLGDYFILYKPRDIVSGDFYWTFDLPDRTLVVAADSTGHGIPGAFMSLIGLSLLNEISHSKKITEPAQILEELRHVIICALNPEKVDEGGKDGMDLALISIFKDRTDPNGIKITYSGGNNSIYVISIDENNEKELFEYKADKQPVGYYSHMKPFTQQDLYVKKGDIIYMGTDGFADQFGGPRGKKIMTKQLKATLLTIAHEPLVEQHKKLDTAFNDWKGDLDQVDDVTVFAIKIS